MRTEHREYLLQSGVRSDISTETNLTIAGEGLCLLHQRVLVPARHHKAWEICARRPHLFLVRHALICRDVDSILDKPNDWDVHLGIDLIS